MTAAYVNAVKPNRSMRWAKLKARWLLRTPTKSGRAMIPRLNTPAPKTFHPVEDGFVRFGDHHEERDHKGESKAGQGHPRERLDVLVGHDHSQVQREPDEEETDQACGGGPDDRIEVVPAQDRALKGHVRGV